MCQLCGMSVDLLCGTCTCMSIDLLCGTYMSVDKPHTLYQLNQKIKHDNSPTVKWYNVCTKYQSVWIVNTQKDAVMSGNSYFRWRSQIRFLLSSPTTPWYEGPIAHTHSTWWIMYWLTLIVWVVTFKNMFYQHYLKAALCNRTGVHVHRRSDF